MRQPTLIDIAHGIFASDFLDVIVPDTAEIVDYAEFSGRDIDYREAQRIQSAVLKWLDGVEDDSLIDV